MRSGPNPKLLGLAAGLAIVIGGGAVYFQYNDRQAALKEVKRLELELPDEDELRASLAQAKTRYSEAEEHLAHLEQSVPSVAYIPTLLKELEQRGFESKMTVTGVRPVIDSPGQKKEETKQVYQEVDIEVTGRGDYDAIQTLLARLKTFPKIIAVKKIDLSPKFKGQGSTYEYIDVNVRLKAFVFPEGEDQTRDKAKEAADVVASLQSPNGGTL